MKKQITLALGLSILGCGAIAQKTARIALGAEGMYPSAVEFIPGQAPDFVPGSVLLQKQGAFVKSSDVILKHSEKDQLGQEHFRYQQKMNGIPVEGATYVVHVAGGKILRENGEFVSAESSNLATTPAIGRDAALQIAMNAFGAKIYKWQLASEEAFVKKESGNAAASFLPEAELVYYSGENSISAENMHLAYKLDIYAHQPVGRRIYFIDAETGIVLGQREIMHTVNAVGSATTAYSGSQSVVTDQVSGSSFRLRETGRGGGIQTFNLGQGMNYGAATDFIDADNNWNNVNSSFDQYATDAHWGAEKTYDYYYNTYGRNSIDNAGFPILSYVHYSTGYFNAFWDGARMTYGDGGATDGNKPLTALDVCAHEITHGLTANTAGLYYSYESGALNEGFSDIFGTTIEFFAKPATANWLIGDAFYTVRSMSDPNALGQPDTYMGINWSTGTADNGGVHNNSGVLNFWYYLLTQGGSGTNDNNAAYAVTGIGMTKAAAIAYRTLTVYLTPTSQYANARTSSIQAATDLYGAGSNEVLQVANAWDAVGVAGPAVSPVPTPIPTPTPTPTTTCTDVYESNDTRSAARSMPVNTNITAMISSSTDKDWFKFTTMSSAPKVKVTLCNLPANYDIRLYNSSGSQIAWSHNSGNTSESISYNYNRYAATYYVQVYGYNSSAYNTTNCYTLRASTSNVNQLLDEGNWSLTDDFTSGIGDVETENIVTVYPNPAKNKLSLNFNADEAGKQSLVITDLVGHVIMNTTLTVQAGINDISVPLTNYRSGLYFLNLSGKPPVKFQVAE